jgi:hypothetical protein
VSWRRVLEAVFILLEFPSPSRRIFIGSHSLPPLWFAVSILQNFHACSSPAPAPVKPQPTPAILSQEPVHTVMSITHHTRKRPSTGPRTTHGPHEGESPPPPRGPEATCGVPRHYEPRTAMPTASSASSTPRCYLLPLR